MESDWLVELDVLIRRKFKHVNFFLESSALVFKRFIFLQKLVSTIRNLNYQVKLSLATEFEVNLGWKLGFEDGKKFMEFLVWGVDELNILLVGEN